MSFESILEQQRRYHEERERLMDTMTKEMLRKKATHRDQINSEHMVKLLLDRYTETSSHLKDMYDDKDGSRKEEIQALSGPNEFTEFYLRLKNIRQYYPKNSSEEIAIPMSMEYEQFMRQLQETEDGEPLALASFTDEEGYGRFLDLHQCFEIFLNIKGLEKLDYLTYLQKFDRFHEIQKDRKNFEYRQYLLEYLFPYLLDFLKRCKPLINIEKDLINVKQDFELKWEQGIFPGWPKETGGALAKGGASLDLSGFSSWEELASVGLDRLKSALLALGMKCGGTLEERAKRLFATKDKSFEDLDPSLFMKDADKTKRGNKETIRHKEIAGMEAQIYRLVDLLSEQRSATLDNVRRKQARAGEDNEDDEDVGGGDISDDDSGPEEDGLIYNPKNLPLGWDGKPIPYWLYKLHGLNMYFNCEICGNHTYRGPKAFQRHFAEWRHAHGMRCLGIPNTAHFANITSIEDALSLWNKLKNNKDDERWKPEMEEEFEDSLGNVVNKRTYDDLRKQGLL
ncbi:unnamed protein product [Rotaria socialis]|uniref:Matrin-type domain-containing protein n=1 Tax=Rotaria socialis TaxID=392032 RepID=A0A821H8F4_9BILA|nr:unnamed protein product [Rotaria socialis]CAF3812357.1 unnamed protein product [Rotaria socialis]CAF4459685.1 unnamed protein product [Rotaria socialis]CAF4679558.1 unnamed protein product [Rotaria socialis]